MLLCSPLATEWKLVWVSVPPRWLSSILRCARPLTGTTTGTTTWRTRRRLLSAVSTGTGRWVTLLTCTPPLDLSPTTGRMYAILYHPDPVFLLLRFPHHLLHQTFPFMIRSFLETTATTKCKKRVTMISILTSTYCHGTWQFVICILRWL